MTATPTNFYCDLCASSRRAFFSHLLYRYVVPVPSYSRNVYARKPYSRRKFLEFSGDKSPKVQNISMRPTKDIHLRQTASISMYNVGTEGAVWAVRVPETVQRLENKNFAKSTSLPLCHNATTCAIWMKLHRSRDIDGVINFASFCFDRFRGFCSARCRKSASPMFNAYCPWHNVGRYWAYTCNQFAPKRLFVQFWLMKSPHYVFLKG